MADRCADYVITAVRFNSASAGTHIEEVRVYEDDGSNLVNLTTNTRSSVVTQLENGYTLCTATKSGENKWTKGAEVKSSHTRVRSSSKPKPTAPSKTAAD